MLREAVEHGALLKLQRNLNKPECRSSVGNLTRLIIFHGSINRNLASRISALCFPSQLGFPLCFVTRKISCHKTFTLDGGFIASSTGFTTVQTRDNGARWYCYGFYAVGLGAAGFVESLLRLMCPFWEFYFLNEVDWRGFNFDHFSFNDIIITGLGEITYLFARFP